MQIAIVLNIRASLTYRKACDFFCPGNLSIHQILKCVTYLRMCVTQYIRQQIPSDDLDAHHHNRTKVELVIGNSRKLNT